MNRILVPEILDYLDPSDPEAIRSRRDLRRLDVFLGNSRWILRTLAAGEPPRSIVEIGAGEGNLCRRLAKTFPAARVAGLDLVRRPADLEKWVDWIAGDFFESLAQVEADTVAGSLILHHFTDDRLRDLGKVLQNFHRVVVCEPWRDVMPFRFSALAVPFVGRVTRHDMPVSIRAGFRAGELPSLLGLDAPGWSVRESSRWRGVIRMVAWRR